jgi:hypothetical protein
MDEHRRDRDLEELCGVLRDLAEVLGELASAVERSDLGAGEAREAPLEMPPPWVSQASASGEPSEVGGGRGRPPVQSLEDLESRAALEQRRARLRREATSAARAAGYIIVATLLAFLLAAILLELYVT